MVVKILTSNIICLPGKKLFFKLSAEIQLYLKMISSRCDSRIPFYLLIMLSLSFVLSIFAMQLFAGVMGILWLFEKNSEKKKAIDTFVIAVSFYGLIRLLTIIFSEYPEISVHTLYKEALFFLSVFSIGFYLKTLERQKILLVIYSFIAGSVINSLIGLIRFNLGIIERAESFSSGYTVFSGYLLAVLGIALLTFNLSEIKNKFSYLIILSIALILSGIVTSLGRANIAIAGLVIAAALIFKIINVKQFLFVSIIAVVLSYISFINNSSGVTQRIESPAQLSDRDIIYKGALELVWEHPTLGFGPGTFKRIFPIKEEFADKGIGGWHNQIFQVYFESGFIGLASYIVLLLTVFLSAFRFLKRKIPKGNKAIVMGALISVSSLFLSAFFSGFIDSPVLSIVFAFVVSLMTADIYKSTYSGDKS